MDIDKELIREPEEWHEEQETLGQEYETSPLPIELITDSQEKALEMEMFNIMYADTQQQEHRSPMDLIDDIMDNSLDMSN